MTIKLGYWSPVFGGWLRNVNDEGMDWTFAYQAAVAKAAEEAGFHTTLVAELLLNDIKAKEAPVLDAFTLSAALASVTKRLRIMAAIRPGYREPGHVAKEAASIDHISNGRFELNVVAAWFEEESRRLGGNWVAHDQRYKRATEFVDVLKGLWSEDEFHYKGDYYQLDGGISNPKPVQQVNGKRGIPLYAGGESEDGKNFIASRCDSYLMHGDPAERLAPKVADMEDRVSRLQPGADFDYGVAAYTIVRDTEDEVKQELKRITTMDPASPNYHSYKDWVKNSKLDQKISLENYSVSNRGLQTGLVGTPEQVAERLGALEDAGVGLVLLQMSPQLEEIQRFGEKVVPLL